MMRGFLKFFLIFSSVLLLSAFLAPLLYDFLPYVGSFFSDDPEFLKFKFEKIFNRLVMIGSLIAIIRFVRIRKETFVRYGLDAQPGRLGLFVKTFLISIGVLILFVAIRSAFGHAIFEPRQLSAAGWLGAIVKVSFSALLIAAIEECFFRGFIFSTIKNRLKLNLILSVIITNVFYASLHFVSHKKPFIGEDPQFTDSLRLMSAPFMSMADIQTIWMAALGLFIFGLILNGLFLKTGSLYPAMGVHAGCVFFLKLDGKFVEFLDSGHALLWGSSQIYDGIFGWFCLLILGFIAMVSVKKENEQGEAHS